MKDSHAQLSNTKAKHATSLDTLPGNVSKGNNTDNTNLHDLKHIKYRSMNYMTAQTVTYQLLVPVKIPFIYR